MSERIPRIIHYCWLSGDSKSEKIQACIDSWSHCMPDYEIICWDKNRFPIDSVGFVAQAVEARKWAFAADYIRLHALYHHGGIYLDSDVKVFKSFNPFLHHAAFSSVEFWPDMFHESIKRGSYAGLGIEAAVIGAEKGHPWIKCALDFYREKEFINAPAFWNNLIISGVLAELSANHFGFSYIPMYQVLKDDVHLYPPDVFSSGGVENAVKYSSHLCMGSWREPQRDRFLSRAIRKGLRLAGKCWRRRGMVGSEVKGREERNDRGSEVTQWSRQRRVSEIQKAEGLA